MINCVFKEDKIGQLGERLYRCPGCGYETTIPKLRRNCPIHKPGIVRKASQLLTARRKWIEAGKPVRSDEEKTTLLKICSECHYLDKGSCLLCGCPVMRAGTFGDKLRWATESCPIGRW